MSRATDYDHLYKLLLIGDSAVGKSCLLVRFADGEFSDTFTTTIGVDFKIQTLDIDNKTIKLQIWDTAGQERFRTITASYYHGAQGIIVVFDVTKRQSFENVQMWLREIEDSATENVSILLVGNKTDLADQREVTDEQAKAFAAERNIEYIATSAKTAENVENAFLSLARQIKQRLDSQPAPPMVTDSLAIDEGAEVDRGCSC
ncbi:hypothetical protein RCL1_000735 [Eukaryota sp. TZLM3-RCL]